MTQRERIMGLAVGVMVVGLGVYWVIDQLIVDQFRQVNNAITSAEERRVELVQDLKAVDNIAFEWSQLTKRTLAADPETAQIEFQQNMLQLLERHGLWSDPDTRDAKISPGQPSADKAGFVRVPLTISTSGTLKEIVGFLRDFYRQDYIARLEKVNVRADTSVISEVNNPRRTTRRGRGSAGASDPILNLNVTAATLVMPADFDEELKLKRPPIDEVQELETGRLVRDLTAYNQIFATNIFKPWTPPPPPPPKPKPKDPEPVVVDNKPKRPPPPPPPPPDPRAGVDKYVVRYVGRIMGAPRALVYDTSNPALLPEEYTHDDLIDDGTILLIHRKGLVVRVEDDGGVTDYFYPLGANFKEREVLDPYEHPEVWEDVLQEFQALDDEPAEQELATG